MHRRAFVTSLMAASVASVAGTSVPVAAGHEPVLIYRADVDAPVVSGAGVLLSDGRVLLPSFFAERHPGAVDTADGRRFRLGPPEGDPWSTILTAPIDGRPNGVPTASVRERPPRRGEMLIFAGPLGPLGMVEIPVTVAAADTPPFGSPAFDPALVVGLDYVVSYRGGGLFDPDTGEIVGVALLPPSVRGRLVDVYMQAAPLVDRGGLRIGRRRPRAVIGLVVDIGEETLTVREVVPGSPADFAGIPVGAIVDVDGNGGFVEGFRSAVHDAARRGRIVPVTVRTDGETTIVAVVPTTTDDVRPGLV